MLKTGLFYLQLGDEKIRKISEDMPLSLISNRFILINENRGRYVKIIPKTYYTAVVKIYDESDTLQYDDVFWLIMMKIPRSEREKLLEWLARKYNLDVSKDAKIDVFFSVKRSVIVEDKAKKKRYIIYPDGKVVEERHVKIKDIEFVVEAPKEKIDTAISVTRDILELLGDIEVSSIWPKEVVLEENGILKIGIPGIKLGRGRKFNLYILYSIPTGYASAVLVDPLGDYQWWIIQKELTGKEAEDTIKVLSVSGNLEYIRKMLKKAFTMIKNAEKIRTRNKTPEQIIKRIERAIKKDRLPVLDDVSPELYFIAIARGGKAAEYMRKHYRREVGAQVYAIEEYIRPIVEKLGEEAKKEFEELLKEEGKELHDNVYEITIF